MSEFGNDEKPVNEEEKPSVPVVPKPSVPLPTGFAPLVPPPTVAQLGDLPEISEEAEDPTKDEALRLVEEQAEASDEVEESEGEESEEEEGGETAASPEITPELGGGGNEEDELQGPDVASIFAAVERESAAEEAVPEDLASDTPLPPSGLVGFTSPKVKPVMLNAAAVYGAPNEGGEIEEAMVTAETENQESSISDGLSSLEPVTGSEGDEEESEEECARADENEVTSEEEPAVEDAPEMVSESTSGEEEEQATDEATVGGDANEEGHDVTRLVFESEEETLDEEESEEEAMVQGAESDEVEQSEETSESDEGPESGEEECPGVEVLEEEQAELADENEPSSDDESQLAAELQPEKMSVEDVEEAEGDEESTKEPSVLEILAKGDLEEVAEQVISKEDLEGQADEEGDEEEEPKPKVPDASVVAGLVAKEREADEMEIIDPEKERARRHELFTPEKPSSRWAFWRRPSKRDQQLARVSEGYLEMVDLVRAISSQLQSQTENNLILRDSLSHLPEAMKGLENFSKSQLTVGKALKEIHGQLRNSGAKDQRLVESMVGFNESMVGFNDTLKGMDDTSKATMKTFDRVQERMRDSDIRMENLFQKVQDSEEKVSDTMVRLQRNMAIMQSLFLICLMIVIGVLVFTVMGSKDTPAPAPEKLPVEKEKPVGPTE